MTHSAGSLNKAHRLLSPRIAYLIGTRSPSGEPNLIPISNATSISVDPEQVLIAVHHRWVTCDNLCDAPGFTLSVPDFSQIDGAWKLGARYSGYSVESRAEKLATCGLGLDHTASQYGPILSDGLGWMSCRIIERFSFGGDHLSFAAIVESVFFDDARFRNDGTPLQEIHPLMQVTGNIFATAAPFTSVDYFER
jgi:flavin reductase (DIM6/NTAB) family NADH-FMN oxidoreductase RutF